MSRSIASLFSLVLLLGTSFVGAASLNKRQVGDLQCNIDRIQTLGAIAAAQNTTSALTQQLASDPAGSQLISEASGFLNSTQDGLTTILIALFEGTPAPPTARQQVADGISNAFDALSNITSTDPAVNSNVATCREDLIKASSAGEGVIENCK